MEEGVIESGSYSRRAWVWGDAGATNLCLFLDAELYMNRVNAHSVFQALALPDTACLFLSNQDAATRHVDYTCNDAFSEFVIASVLGWAKAPFPSLTSGGHAICGLSLSGLAGAYLGMRHPFVFSKVLSQSGSFWWNDEWFAKNVTQTDLRIYVSVGDEELQTGVAHPPSGLFQGVCQLDSVKRAAGALCESGAKLHLHTYSGGHDPACWNAELRDALEWLYETKH